MPALVPVARSRKYVTLEPLPADHHDGLVAAASDSEPLDPRHTAVPRPAEMRAKVERRLAASRALLPQSVLPALTIQDRGRTVRVQDPHSGKPGAIIGKSTSINAGASSPGVDIFIPRKGAKRHGVRRAQTRTAAGSQRDTVVFSMLPAKRPQASTGLDCRLARYP